MSKQPIEVLLNKVEWTTHEGILRFDGLQVKVYQLSDGQRVFDAESLAMALGGDDPSCD